MRTLHLSSPSSAASHRFTPNPTVAPLAKILAVYIADCQARCVAGMEGTGQAQARAWRDLEKEVEGARDFLNGVLMDEEGGKDGGGVGNKGEKEGGKFRREVREGMRVDAEWERLKKEMKRVEVERAKARADKRRQHHRFETEVLEPADTSWLEGEEVFSRDYAPKQDAEILRRNRERDELREEARKAKEREREREREKEKEKARKAGSQRTKKRHHPDTDTQPFAAGDPVVAPAPSHSTALKHAEPFPPSEARQRHSDRRRVERELPASVSRTQARAEQATAPARPEKSQRRQRSEAEWYAEVLAEWDMQPAESMFQRRNDATAHLPESADPPPKAKARTREPAMEEEGARKGFLRLGRGPE